jgi:hypothetical protein
MPRSPLKLPAYAKGLIARRTAGQHPHSVLVVLGADWTANSMRMPRLAIFPNQYRPGAFDLRVVSGVICYLDVREACEAWTWLAGELAQHALTVAYRCCFPVYAGEAQPRREWEDIRTYALASALANKRWPDWWPSTMRWDLTLNARAA